jgi:hypothetical protein
MKARLSLLAALSLLACEAPPVASGADARQNTFSGRIEGTVVAATTARGNAVLFLFDAARPPPPLGTGRPITFTVISKQALFGAAGAGESGPFSAPFSFSLVAAGHYTIQGFIDVSDDFVPWYRVSNEPHTGDVGGAALADGFASRVIEVGLDAAGHPLAVREVPVSFGESARVPVDRPLFAPTLTSLTLSSSAPSVLELNAAPVSQGVLHEPAPLFLAQLVDADGDGVPDDSNGDGVPDFWPRVVVRKVADGNALADENDLDDNGVLDTAAGFADYEHVNPATGQSIAPDGLPDLVVLAAGFDFTALLPQLLDAQGKVKKTPTPVTSLTLVIQPRAIDARDPSKLQVLKAVPKGRYAITIIQSTGQTWRVPNELTPGVAEALGLPPIASQAFVLQSP